jgi:hypothetical protein
LGLLPEQPTKIKGPWWFRVNLPNPDRCENFKTQLIIEPYVFVEAIKGLFASQE